MKKYKIEVDCANCAAKMDKKAHEALERIRKDVTLTTSDLENQDAAEFFNELADWAYANGEAMLIDDEPESQDNE